MIQTLKVSVGQYSSPGRKEINQDFYGFCAPQEPQLSAKGIAIALADGISSSDVSHVASEAAVTGFLEDYYSTSETWSVKTSAERVLGAINSWLFAQTQQGAHRYEKDRGYVCTLSSVIFKSTTAHVFHVGDTRVYRVSGDQLEQLTDDHRVWISSEQSYLARALGIDSRLSIDYCSVPLSSGDIFILATDGVYEYVDAKTISTQIATASQDLVCDWDAVAQSLVEMAYERGSTDNLTLQIIRIDELPAPESNEMFRQICTLPFAPAPDARTRFDGYAIQRELKISSRSHIYLAVDEETNQQIVLKLPSLGMRDDPAYLERFLMEEWIARRINNPHVLKPCAMNRKRSYLYVATEYIEGQSLAQWMVDHPNPDLTSVRNIIEQIAKGLRAFHRLEMLHQDIKPDNIMIDKSGTVKIIDFGATRVAGIAEVDTPIEQITLLGSAQYAAPEYFLGATGSSRSDLFSLGVIVYQMLSGELPYGIAVAKTTTKKAQKKLQYRSLLFHSSKIPVWVDEAVRKALAIDPFDRYQEISEFVQDLHRPNPSFQTQRMQPLIDRNPVAFWKSVSLALLLAVIILVGISAFK